MAALMAIACCLACRRTHARSPYATRRKSDDRSARRTNDADRNIPHPSDMRLTIYAFHSNIRRKKTTTSDKINTYNLR
eukprot:6211438-Pleurochrysis_carterae.AAC.2